MPVAHFLTTGEVLLISKGCDSDRSEFTKRVTEAYVCNQTYARTIPSLATNKKLPLRELFFVAVREPTTNPIHLI